MLLRLVKENKDWASIAQQFPDRDEEACQMKYCSLVLGRLRTDGYERRT